MTTVFADTFYWIALTNPFDAAHIRAQEFTDDVVTTEEVLSEYLNYFASSARLRRKASSTVEAIFQDSTVRVIPQSPILFRRARAIPGPSR